MGKIRIKELREEKGLTQAQLAKAIGLTRIVISYYENGYSEPSVGTIEKLCNYFEVSADYLLGFKDF